MEFNILKIVFTLMTLFIVVIGGLINNFEKCMPTFMAQSFRYGKLTRKEKSSIKVVEVPKRWFKHFYVFAAVWSTGCLAIIINVYFLGGKVSHSLNWALDCLGTSHRKAGVSALSVLIAATLTTMQCWRRLYETCFVSVYSHGKINLAHYVIGYFHYFGAVIAILVEAPAFTSISIEHKAVVTLSDLKWSDILGSALFLWAWCHQFQAAKILANLRKNKNGKVVTLKHDIPVGDWFEVISSPHLLCEVLLYLALTFILMGNYTWLFVFFWVLSNQMEIALLTHWWYMSHFKDYPKERYAFIPYLL